LYFVKIDAFVDTLVLNSNHF